MLLDEDTWNAFGTLNLSHLKEGMFDLNIGIPGSSHTTPPEPQGLGDVHNFFWDLCKEALFSPSDETYQQPMVALHSPTTQPSKLINMGQWSTFPLLHSQDAPSPDEFLHLVVTNIHAGGIRHDLFNKDGCVAIF